MQIFVDADACPVVAIIEKIAKDNKYLAHDIRVIRLPRHGVDL